MPYSTESWDRWRARMLEETSRFIEWGLRHPELIEWIPVKPAEEGGFPRRVSNWFWGTVLASRLDDGAKGWQTRLLRRPPLFPHRS